MPTSELTIDPPVVLLPVVDVGRCSDDGRCAVVPSPATGCSWLTGSGWLRKDAMVLCFLAGCPTRPETMAVSTTDTKMARRRPVVVWVGGSVSSG